MIFSYFHIFLFSGSLRDHPRPGRPKLQVQSRIKMNSNFFLPNIPNNYYDCKEKVIFLNHKLFYAVVLPSGTTLNVPFCPTFKELYNSIPNSHDKFTFLYLSSTQYKKRTIYDNNFIR